MFSDPGNHRGDARVSSLTPIQADKWAFPLPSEIMHRVDMYKVDAALEANQEKSQ